MPANGEFDVVVVHTLDRWARDQMILLESQDILATNHVTLVSITEPIDWASPMGKWMGRRVSNNGESFSHMLGVHVEKGINGRVEQGLQSRNFSSVMPPDTPPAQYSRPG